MAYARRPSSRSRRSYSRRSGFSKRRSVWIRTGVDLGTTANGLITGADVLPDNLLDAGAKLGCTITRIKLSSTFLVPVAVGAMAFNAGVGLGMAILPSASRPGPMVDSNAISWMFYEVIHPIDPTGIVDPATTSTSALFSRIWDVKSQRVITQPGESLVLCCQPGNMDVTASSHSLSVLVKLA